ILFDTPASPGPGYRCRLENIGLYGANVGFRVAKSSSNSMEVACVGVSFANCTTGLRAISTAGGAANSLDLEIEDCWIRDFPITANPPIADIGIELTAGNAGSEIGQIDAVVTNLRTSGGFTGTEGMGSSSIIKVSSSGVTPEHPGGIGGTPAAIPEVVLEIQGGHFEGHNKEGGWNYGIYADVISARDIGSLARDYVAGYRISMSGLTLSGFVENGIRAHASLDTRGSLVLNGGTKVSNTRDTSGATQVAPSGTGIYLQNREGYLALQTRQAKISGNATHGVFLSNQMDDGSGKQSPNYGLPEGLLLDMESTVVSGNEGDGLKMIVGGAGEGGVVGGTRYLNPLDSQYYHVPSSSWLEFPSGQGRVVRSAIHNNYGRGMNGQLVFGSASVRLVRSVLWNNHLEGWRFHVEDNVCRMACPIIFSTVAGNGDGSGAGASASITRSPLVTTNRYNLNVLATSPGLLHTKFLHSIFAHKNQQYSSGPGGQPDFGGELATSIVVEEADGQPSGAYEVYISGVRTGEEVIDHPLSFYNHRLQSFEGSISVIAFRGVTNNNDVVWTSESAEQFRFQDIDLDGLGNSNDDSYGCHITDWIGDLLIPSGDYAVDFNGIPTASGFSGTNWTGTVAWPGFQMNKGAFEQ
ncbi:MAG: hypothetical protein ACPG31_11400, partial [Planctomycetota bacterium]